MPANKQHPKNIAVTGSNCRRPTAAYATSAAGRAKFRVDIRLRKGKGQSTRPLKTRDLGRKTGPNWGILDSLGGSSTFPQCHPSSALSVCTLAGCRKQVHYV